MEQTLRTFIAIELDDRLRDSVNRLERQLQEQNAARLVRWVAPQNIHLTCKFLGDTPSGQLPALKDALARAAQGIAPFTLEARGLGCFPNARRPNNLWVGLTGDVDSARRLVRQLEDACAAVGFPRDPRGFTPHLTLGRVKRDLPSDQRARAGQLVSGLETISLGKIHAGQVHLIKSDLRPAGPVYTALAVASLKGGDQDLEQKG